MREDVELIRNIFDLYSIKREKMSTNTTINDTKKEIVKRETCLLVNITY
jgi:hypothetical protein